MNITNCTPVLFVRDAKKARDFYTDVLGMTVIANHGDLNFIFKEGFALWQILDGNIILQKLDEGKVYDSQVTSRFELCFETENITEVYDKLKAEKVKFLHEMNEEIWGQRTIRFYDPDGHLIEVGEGMAVFVRRIYEEEGKDIEAAARRMYMTPEAVRHFIE